MDHTRRMRREHRVRLSWVKKFAVAFRGIYLAVVYERSCWVHLAMTLATVVAAAILRASFTEWCILGGLVGMVWTAELLNTAIERLTEVVEPREDARIGAVLDISAGAVLFAAIVAAIIGGAIFLYRLLLLLAILDA